MLGLGVRDSLEGSSTRTDVPLRRSPLIFFRIFTHLAHQFEFLLTELLLIQKPMVLREFVNPHQNIETMRTVPQVALVTGTRDSGSEFNAVLFAH
jgi:hypothetical protein